MNNVRLPKPPITTALKHALKQIDIEGSQYKVYSDPRQKGKALGVKFVGLRLTQDQMDTVVSYMTGWGYKFVYARYNSNSWGTWGTRFCFLNPN